MMSTESRISLPISGMTCSACVARVEKVLNRLPGVSAQVSLATETARVDLRPGHASQEQIVEAIRAAGYEVGKPRPDADAADLRTFWIACALSLPFLLQMLVMVSGLPHKMLPPWWQLLLATPVQFWIGRRFFIGAWHALRGGTANMDVLVALGTSAAYFYSVAVMFVPWPGQHVYFEASVSIITLVLLGKILETRARRRTNDALKDLAKLLPATAHLERDGQLADVPADQVQRNDIFLLRPDERAPVDGMVMEGQSDMDESLLTGESTLAAKGPGSAVYAGARNAQGQLRCRATRVGARTHLAEVGQMVEEAQASKAPVQRLADRIAGIFVPAILVLAVLTFGGWWIANGQLENALINAVAVLVIACPCALGLAIPTAVVVGMGCGARHGVLLRHAEALEKAGRINQLVVDKTGTLTEGRPSVMRVTSLCEISEEGISRIAASIEQGSDHPIARAVKEHAARLGVAVKLPSELTNVPGKGSRAQLEGQTYWLGSLAYMSELGRHWPRPGVVGDTLAPGNPQSPAPSPGPAYPQPAPNPEGHTLVALADAHSVLGTLAIFDPVRATSSAAVRQLQGMGIEVVMLTGDHQAVAERVAAETGITQYRAQVMPQEKSAAVRSLQAAGKIVGMAGDGVNDAPALANADVGFAMGGGTDLAIQSADVTLMSNDLRGVISAISLSRATLRIIRQNLFFALIYNLLGIPMAAMGLLNPVLAGAAMAMSSVCVVTNSLRLRRWQPELADR